MPHQCSVIPNIPTFEVTEGGRNNFQFSSEIQMMNSDFNYFISETPDKLLPVQGGR